MDNNIDVYLSMQENVTTQMPAVTSALAANKAAIRELAMGTSYLGGAMLGLSVAMKNSNNSALQGTANLLGMAGGILTAVGSAAHFVSAIAKMTSALQKFNVVQAIASALSGPAGWVKLAVGLGVAGVAVYGVSRAGRSETPISAKPLINITQNIAGSVVSERQLTDNVHKGMLIKQDRAYSIGLNR
jgi:hypothetical protein